MTNNTLRNFKVALAGIALSCNLLWAQEKGLLKPGDKIPGAFQALSVTLPPTMLTPIPQAGRVHFPVWEYPLNPAVLIFARRR